MSTKSSNQNATLRVAGLSKRFGESSPWVVDAVDFEVEPGEFFVLLGPSGCGKTTTLRMLAGLTQPDRGSISMGEETWVTESLFAPIEKRSLGLVFQDYALFPHLTAQENIGFGLKQLSSQERKERISSLLKMMQLQELAQRPVQQLSGGEQQRVSLARAVARYPALLLMDEPFGNLDARLRKELRHQLHRLFRQRGMSVVLVTHEQEEALQLADRIAVMDKGRIQQLGTPEELYFRPRNAFVADFLGTANLLTVEARGLVGHHVCGEIPLATEASGEVTLCLRPEHWSLAGGEESGCIPGQVMEVEFRGASYACLVETELGELRIATDFRTAPRPGEQVYLRPSEPAHLLQTD